jgi:hypothetical protein
MSAKHLAKLHKYITTDKPTKEKLSEFIKDLAYSNEATDRTISTRYSLFKKHIRNNHPEYDDEFLKNLNPPIELTKKLIEENGERRMARKMVEFDQVFIDKILALKGSAIPFETLCIYSLYQVEESMKSMTVRSELMPKIKRRLV